LKIKPRHIRKAAACIRTGNIKHLLRRGKLIQFVWPLACNLNCQMCHQKNIRAKHEEEVDLNRIGRIFDNMKSLGVTQVNLIGGEFFINKEKAFKIIDMLEEKSMLYSIATNSTMLTPEDICHLNMGWGLMEIDISLDGFKDTHDSIRGVPGTFDKTVENIKIIKNYGIPVMLVCVVQKKNLDELPEFIRFVKSLNVDSLTLVQEYSANEKEINESKEILQNISGKSIEIFSSSEIDKIVFKYDLQKFIDQVSKAKKIAAEIDLELNTSFDINNNKFSDVYDKSARDKNNVYCDQLNCSQIDWTGAINICPFIRINDMDCGKAYERIEKDYFKNDESKKIISKIVEQNLLPICTRCCSFKIRGKKDENIS